MDKRLFTIYYTDGSFLSYRLLDSEYKTIGANLGRDTNIETEIGFLQTKDMRSIIVQRELPEDIPNESAYPDLTPDQIEYIKQAQAAEEYMKDIKRYGDDEDYEGGMIDG